MKSLTTSARKIYGGLIAFNLILILCFSQLALYYDHTQPRMHPKAVDYLLKLTNRLQKSPPASWPYLLKAKSVPWLKMTLSETPQYKKNAILKLQPQIIIDLIDSHQKLEVSVFISTNAWLNIKVLPQHRNQNGIIAFLALLLGIIFLGVNYWLVSRLNAPLNTILQHLNSNPLQEHWLPIPESGNSDEKALQRRLNELQGKVSKLLANRTKVVAAISHDLRTPLTRLKLRAEQLQEELQDNLQCEKMLHDIVEMEMMISETLAYFRDLFDEEKPQPLDLIAMLTSLIEDNTLQEENLTFQSDCDKLVIQGDVNLLKRAFNNLINNALFYGQRARITVTSSKKHVDITLQDEGPGLSEKELEAAFHPFFRGDASRSRKTGGTGLGLTIAKEIIQMHQGDIKLSNAKSGGLTISIRLPKPS